MKRFTYLALILTATVSLSACSGSVDTGELPHHKPTPVGVVEVPGDTDVTLYQVEFTDSDGILQKCFQYGGTRGSLTCQAVKSGAAEDSSPEQ